MLPLPHLLIVFAAISGTVLLFGGGAWLWYRISRLEERVDGGPSDPPELTSRIEELRSQVTEAREETRGIRERVDFLERLLEGEVEDVERYAIGRSPEAGASGEGG